MKVFKKKTTSKISLLSRTINKVIIVKLLPFLIFIAFVFGIIISNRVKNTESYITIRNNVKNLLNGDLDYNNTFNVIENNGFDLDVKFKEWEKIKYYREQALLGSKIPIESQQEVPAKIRFKGNTYKVSISLTGGMLEHITDPLQWSLSVKVKDEKTILGMKKFALLKPDARGFLTDWIAHQMLIARGAIGLRSNYIDININGNYHGVYYIEERFDKRLIEFNKRREGIVFKINLALPGADVRKERDIINSDLNYKTEIMPYNRTGIDENLEMKSQLISLIKLWKAFEQDKLKVDQVFDMKQFASLFAITDLLNEKHGMSIHNTRYYFNPITNLIEPIAREWMNLNENKKFGTLYLEGEVRKENFFDNYYLRSKLYHKLYMNKSFKKMYIQELRIISSYEFLDKIFVDKKEEIEYYVSKIKQYNPDYKFPKNVINKHQKIIKDKLFPAKPSISVFYKEHKGYNLELFVRNTTNLPIEINKITYNNIVIDSSEVYIEAKQDIIDQNQKIMINLDTIIENFNSDSLKIYFNVYGLQNYSLNYLGRKVNSKTIVYPKIMDLVDYENLSLPNRKENIEFFPFIKEDKKNKSIIFKKGDINISKDIIIPKGYKVIVKNGTKLNITNFARIISYSPFYFLGSKTDSIFVSSSDTTGQGIVVYNCNEKSEFNYVKFEKLSNIKDVGWNLRGAITFYKSPVFFNNCLFDNNIKGDDFLNIVSTSFIISNTIFKNTNADAFDSDFSKGNITNTKFINIGNDAIDISGTELYLDNIIINKTGDKGISGGESSIINGKNIFLSECEIAVASKDKSTINIDIIEIKNSNLAYCAFQKKPEFGPSNIVVDNSTLENVKTNYLIEIGSELSLNGKNIIIKSNKVKQYLYGAEYGKSSK